jgi:hypothetical protein
MKTYKQRLLFYSHNNHPFHTVRIFSCRAKHSDLKVVMLSAPEIEKYFENNPSFDLRLHVAETHFTL